MTKKDLKRIQLTPKQAQHLERVMQNRAQAELALAKAREDETNTIDLICDAHKIPLTNGIRYENGALIIPQN